MSLTETTYWIVGASFAAVHLDCHPVARWHDSGILCGRQGYSSRGQRHGDCR